MPDGENIVELLSRTHYGIYESYGRQMNYKWNNYRSVSPIVKTNKNKGQYHIHTLHLISYISRMHTDVTMFILFAYLFLLLMKINFIGGLVFDWTSTKFRC